MTQYVEQFPLPNPHGDLGIEIITKAEQLYHKVDTDEAESLKGTLNQLVWKSFGLGIEEISW